MTRADTVSLSKYQSKDEPEIYDEMTESEVEEDETL